MSKLAINSIKHMSTIRRRPIFSPTLEPSTKMLYPNLGSLSTYSSSWKKCRLRSGKDSSLIRKGDRILVFVGVCASLLSGTSALGIELD